MNTPAQTGNESPEELFQRALFLHRKNQIVAAEKIYREILKSNPDHFDSLRLLGVACGQTKKLQEALRLLDRAVSLNESVPSLHYNIGNAQIDAGQFEKAVESFNRALNLQAKFPRALIGRARSLEALKRFPEAMMDLENAIRIKPDLLNAHSRLIDLLCRFGKHIEALEKISQFLTLSPQNIPTLIQKNKILQSLNHNADSIAVASQILAIDPHCAVAYKLKADAFRNTSNLGKALEAYEAALRIQPDFPEAHYGRGIVLQALKRFDEAIVSYKKASLGDHEQKRLQGRAILCRMMICDWADLKEQRQRLADKIEKGNHATTPFAALTVIHLPQLLLNATQLYINDIAPDCSKSYQILKLSNSKKIRIGYFSSDFRNHPVSQLIVGFLECHDHSRFETIGINISPAPKDELTKRVKAALDNFIDVGSLTTSEIITKARSLHLDIAIDLNGLTFGGNTTVFAHRVAPIQVNYLGYPGTSGASYFDYLIGDRIIIPKEHFSYYSEKIAHLPNSYLPNNRKKAISSHTPTRAEAGLPDEGFVFCCFNNSYKISPEIFGVWMRILSQVDGSVLWLSEMNPSAVSNLKKEAQSAGINPERILFAPRTKQLADHLTRHRLANLFLDTLHYNAHTTASDSLWAGVPVLTCIGESFAGRVAASLLHAIKIPELITYSLDEYERMAVSLAQDATRLNLLRQKLLSNQFTTPLFDPQLFAKDIEALYLAMWDRHRKGLPPDHLCAAENQRGDAVFDTQKSYRILQDRV